jgi:hypothetical protein
MEASNEHINKKNSPFFLFWKTCKWLQTFFWLWWRTLLWVMSPWEQFSSYMVLHLTFSVVFVHFWTGSFLITGWEEGDPFPGPPPSFSRFDSTGLFLLAVCTIHGSSWRSAKCEWVTWHNRQICRMRYQWNAYQYMSRNWILSWCVSCHYGAHIEHHWAHKELCEFQCWNIYRFSNTLYGWRFILFYFIVF